MARDLDINTRTYTTLQRSLRAWASTGSPCSPSAGAPLHHVTASPGKIGDIVRTALILTHFEHGYTTYFGTGG
jgi:hypothetical protein